MSDTMIIPFNKSYPVTRDHFNSLIWLFKASAPEKDDRRQLARSFKVEDGICYATDGHRLHVYNQNTTDELPAAQHIPDGVYKIVSATKSQIIISAKDDTFFPDHNCVLRYRPVKCFDGSAIYSSDARYGGGFSSFLRVVYQLGAYMIDYLTDAFIPDQQVWFEKSGPGELCALIIGNDRQIAMVMPLKEN